MVNEIELEINHLLNHRDLPAKLAGEMIYFIKSWFIIIEDETARVFNTKLGWDSFKIMYKETELLQGILGMNNEISFITFNVCTLKESNTRSYPIQPLKFVKLDDVEGLKFNGFRRHKFKLHINHNFINDRELESIIFIVIK